MIKPLTVSVTANALSGKRVRVRRVPMASTMGDLVSRLLPDLQLPSEDSAGRRLAYHARVDRLGRHAHSSELVGDVLASDEENEITLHPNVDAGGGR